MNSYNKNVAIFTEDFDKSTNSAGKIMVDLVIELANNSSGNINVFTLDIKGSTLNFSEKFPDNINIYRMIVSDKSNFGLIKRALFEILLSPKMFLFLVKKRKLFSFSNIIWYSPTIFWSPLILLLSVFNKTHKFLILRDIFPEWAVNLEIIKKPSLKYYFFRCIELLQYHIADVIAIQTNGDAKHFKSNQFFLKKLTILKTWYHPSYPDSSQFHNIKQLKGLGLNNKKLCVYPGNLGIANNQKMLIDFIKNLKDNIDFHFLFIGLKKRDMQLFEDEIKNYDLKNVTLLGTMTQNEIDAVLANAHIGIFSLDSRHKSHNIPGKFLHFISVGLPVFGFCNNSNDIIELIENNFLGKTYSGMNYLEATNKFLKTSDLIDNNFYSAEKIQKYVLSELSPKEASLSILKTFP